MMKRAFTLLELLVVIAIMGLLGTISVGGYQAMKRGMEERGVIQNMEQFIRSAYQRAQIDRVPVDVYCWNETLREETDFEPPLIVGKAVAVRRVGRISDVKGEYLSDEYGDLRFQRLVIDLDKETDDVTSGSGKEIGKSIYRMKGSGSQVQRSVISEHTECVEESLWLPFVGATGEKHPIYRFRLIDRGGVTWERGDAYGFEFAELTLPHNYLVGSQYSTSVMSPVKGEQVLRFQPGKNSGSGTSGGTSGQSTVTIHSLRPNASGSLTAQPVGATRNPTASVDS